AADALGADPRPPRLAVHHHLDALEVRLEHPLAGAGDLLADPAEVLGLPAIGLLVPLDRLLPADRTLHAHVRTLAMPSPRYRGPPYKIETITIAATTTPARMRSHADETLARGRIGTMPGNPPLRCRHDLTRRNPVGPGRPVHAPTTAGCCAAGRRADRMAG